VALAVAGVAGTVMIAVVRPGASAPAPSPQLMAELDAAIAQARREAEARAMALAARPRLGWIVATDEATVRNLTAAELGLRAEPGERIQLGQVMLKGAGGVASLIADPRGAEIPVAQAAFGPQLFISDRSLYVAAVAAIVPRDRRDELRGLLAVARPVDLTRPLRRMAGAGGSARLDVGGRALALGVVPTGPGAPARQIVEATLPAPGGPARLRLSMVAPAPSRRRAALGAALMFVTVFGAGVLWTLGRARGAAAPS